MQPYTFKPKLKVIGKLPGITNSQAIENEPMLLSASVNFAYRKGSLLTLKVLEQLDLTSMERTAKALKCHVVVDSCSVFLLKGMYPTIPGWHCDFIRRYTPLGSKDEKQPYLWWGEAGIDAYHFSTYLVDNPKLGAQTMYLADPFSVNVDWEGSEKQPIWAQVNHAIVQEYEGKLIKQKPGEIMRMRLTSLHTVTPAKEAGWYWGLRVAMSPEKPVNKIRKQVQVYLPENYGW